MPSGTENFRWLCPPPRIAHTTSVHPHSPPPPFSFIPVSSRGPGIRYRWSWMSLVDCCLSPTMASVYILRKFMGAVWRVYGVEAGCHCRPHWDNKFVIFVQNIFPWHYQTKCLQPLPDPSRLEVVRYAYEAISPSAESIETLKCCYVIEVKRNLRKGSMLKNTITYKQLNIVNFIFVSMVSVTTILDKST